MNLLESIAVYVEVAERGSFTAASKVFAITPTMAANHVRRLEQRLGSLLIERTTRKHRLTDLGTSYLVRCKELLTIAALADQVVDDVATAPRGRLRVSAPVTWGTYLLVPVIGTYLREYPDVEIDLSLNDRVVDIADEGYDCVMRSGPLNDSNVVAKRLKDVRLLVAASPAYLRRCGTPKRPCDLMDHTVIPFASWGRNHMLRFSSRSRTDEVKIRGSLAINNGQALVVAAINGFGVIVQADTLIEPMIAAGSLVQVLSQWQLPRRAMHLLRLKDARPSAKLRTFYDHVFKELA